MTPIEPEPEREERPARFELSRSEPIIQSFQLHTWAANKQFWSATPWYSYVVLPQPVSKESD